MTQFKRKTLGGHIKVHRATSREAHNIRGEECFAESGDWVVEEMGQTVIYSDELFWENFEMVQ